jgi:plastocyanin
MKKIISLILIALCFFNYNAQTTHTVNAGSYYYTPTNLTVQVGDSVIWINDGGLHDVNGDINSITNQPFNNPVTFDSPPTNTAGAVIFAYKFTVPGTYNYDCSVGSHAANGMVGSVIVNAQSAAVLNFTAIMDLTTPSGSSSGKAIMLTANQNISDLSSYGFGSATNGGGSDGEEYTFPSISLNGGQHIVICRDSLALSTYFDGCLEQFSGSLYPNLIIESSSEPTGNGNDAYELFFNGSVIETFGDITHSYGTGGFTDLGWAYRDSWAWKDTSASNVGNWVYGGDNCSDSSITTQTSDCPFPLCGSTTSSIINSITENSLVYPNPTSNYIYLNAINGISYSNIYDITGKLMQSTIEKKIDLSSYPNGLYILNIRSNNRVNTYRIIKE